MNNLQLLGFKSHRKDGPSSTCFPLFKTHTHIFISQVIQSQCKDPSNRKGNRVKIQFLEIALFQSLQNPFLCIEDEHIHRSFFLPVLNHTIHNIYDSFLKNIT